MDGFGFAQPAFEVEIRQAAGLNLRGWLQYDGPLDDVAQFADVARPVVAQQFVFGRRRKTADVLGHRGVVLRQKILGQNEDVIAPFAQGRRAELNDIEAMIQILAEIVLADRFDECRGWSRR